MTSKAYRENYKLIRWTPIKPSEPKPVQDKGKAAYFMADIQPFVSPMSGRVISSRPQLRHEERAYGVKQVGNDLKVNDYDPSPVREQVNERAIDAAFKQAVERHWD